MADEDAVDTFYVDLGKKIRAVRDQRSVTQASLANATGLTRSSIANLEAGRQRVPVHTLAAIAASLGTSLDDLAPVSQLGADGVEAREVQREDLDRFSETALRFVHDGLNTLASTRRGAS